MPKVQNSFYKPYQERPNQEPFLKKAALFFKVAATALKVLTLPLKIPGAVKQTFVKPSLPSWETTHSPPEEKDAFKVSAHSGYDKNFYYRIHNGILWFKPIAEAEQTSWRTFGENGLPLGAKLPLTQFTCDGINLTVVDGAGTVFYGHSNKIDFKFDCSDKGWTLTKFSTDWREKWYGLPLVSKLVNAILCPKLNVSKYKKVIMSHRGPDNTYHVDMSGKKIPDPVGVTTLFAASKSGNRTYYTDPWLFTKFSCEVVHPEGGRFIAEETDAACSTLAMICRYYDKNGNIKHKIYSRDTDHDRQGHHPIFPKTYDLQDQRSHVRCCVPEPWLRQPSIPLNGQVALTKSLEVHQTGVGSENRILRVWGKDETGLLGYFEKRIFGRKWTFTPHPFEACEEDFLPTKKTRGQPLAPSREKNYKTDLRGFGKVKITRFIKKSKGEHGLESQIWFKVEGGKDVSFPLYAHRGWKQLFGMGLDKPNQFKIVLTEDFESIKCEKTKELIQRLFKGKREAPLPLNTDRFVPCN